MKPAAQKDDHGRHRHPRPGRAGETRRRRGRSDRRAGPRSLMARTVSDDLRLVRPGLTVSPLTCAYSVERVTGIEPALSAWEAVPSGPVTYPDLRREVSASDRERPLVTAANGPADRGTACAEDRVLAPPPSSSIAAVPTGHREIPCIDLLRLVVFERVPERAGDGGRETGRHAHG
jgi:hypothetical protein